MMKRKFMINNLTRVLLGVWLCLATLMADEALKLDGILHTARQTRAGMYDSFESSVLGKTATPAETAATVRNWREVYSQPAKDLTAVDRGVLTKKYGNAKVFGIPRAVGPYPLGILGAWVTDAHERPEITVTKLEADSPAVGKLEQGDIIVGVNGHLFPDWEDPRLPMGYAIAAAQTRAGGGRLTLHVGRNGQLVDTVVSLPISESYDTTDPYNCERAREIAAKAVQYVIENGDDTMFMDLFLLGCGDEKAIALVRDRMRSLEVPDEIGNNWFPSYQLVSACEYYLLTGDKQVLPKIKALVRGLEKNQFPTGGWGHGRPGGYGYMNQVSQVVLIGFALARECGIEPDPIVFAKGVRQLTRFIGTYGAYGDHLPGVSRYHGYTRFENGGLSAHAILFELLGVPEAAKRTARRTCYLYRTRTGGHAERIFATGWAHIGPSIAPPAEYSMYANNMLWFYELARQRDGSLVTPAYTRYKRNTAATGMVFARALKQLRIAGKAKGAAPMFPVDLLPESPSHPLLRGKSLTNSELEPEIADLPKKWDVSRLVVQPVKPDGELATSSFASKVASESYTHCVVTVSANMGGEVWLNGSCIAIFPETWKKHKEKEQTLILDTRVTRLLKEGKNTVALRAKTLGNETNISIAFGPAKQGGDSIMIAEPTYYDFRGNGWSGSLRQHMEGLEWAFRGKSPKEIARYLAYPDAAGAHVAYKALAQGGEEALELCKRLVQDKHAGIRVGAWDALGEMHKQNPISPDHCKEISAIALKQVKEEEAYVGMALCKAVVTMAEGDDLYQLLTAIGGMNDSLARSEASQFIAKGFSGTPEQRVRLLTPIIAAKLNGNDIRALGGALRQVSEHAQTEVAGEALPAIASVLDEIAPDTRGMFTDSLMHGGLLTIEHHLSHETEKTPQLAAGLSKCFVKVPYTDWPGWAYSSLFLRRLIYRLGPASADDIDAVAETMLKVDLGGQTTARANELKMWSALLLRTNGDQEKLKQEALRLARSIEPHGRTVALSLVWPSQHALKIQSGRYYSPTGVPDDARVADPDIALQVALAAARTPEKNTAIDWFMIWLTVNKYADDKHADAVLKLVADYLANYSWNSREPAFHYHAIHQALLLVEKYQADTRQGSSSDLADGLAKTYLTCSSSGWYEKTREKLIELLKKLNAESRRTGIASGIIAVEKWMETTPKDDLDLILERINRKTIRDRMDSLRALSDIE